MIIRVLTARSDHRARDARHGEPVTFGVPLPAGLTADPSNWNLASTTAGGTRLPLQTEVLDRWADGTARWVLVDAQIDSASDGSGEFFIDTDGPAVEPSARLIVSESGGRVVVDTGVTSFEVRPGTALLSGSTLVVTGRAGMERSVTWQHVAVETRGALRAVVALRGTCEVDRGRAFVFTARLHFFAGTAAVRVLLTVRNPQAAVHPGGFWDLGNAGSLFIKDLSLRLNLAHDRGSEDPGLRLECSPEIGLPVQTFTEAVSLYQDSSGGEAWQSTNHINRERRVPVSFRGYRLSAAGSEQNGLRATPAMAVRSGQTSVAAAISHFWQNFPMAVDASPAGLVIHFFPGQFADLHELQGGEQKTHECWVQFGGASAASLDWCRARTMAAVNAAHVLSSGAVPFLAPLDQRHSGLVAAAVDGDDRFELKREVIDQFGWRHFGEIYGDHESIRQKNPPIVSHYNNQYDPIAGFIYQYLRTGDLRWWQMADELTSHVIDIDIYHTSADWPSYNGGMFWHTYHYGDADTATHRTYPKAAKGRIRGGGPSADHNYTTGMLLHYFLTGDAASREAVLDLARYVINLDDGNKTVFRWIDRTETGWATVSAGYYGPGRGPANSLNVLMDGYRLSGDRVFLDKAEHILRRVVHPDEDVRRHRLDDPEARWFYTMFLQSLGKYLHAKAERGDLDDGYAYGRAALLTYARWMAQHEHPYLEKPEKLEFPTETWAAQDIRKSDVFHYAALHAGADERAIFAERGRFYHHYSTSTLATMPTRTLARPVIVLLTSGFMDPWMAAHPNAAEPAPARSGPFAPQPVFVPQRARVKQKLVMAIAASGVVTLLGAAWFLLR